MRTSRQVGLLFSAAALYAAADAPWKTKQAADWTVDDAQLVGMVDGPGQRRHESDGRLPRLGLAV